MKWNMEKKIGRWLIFSESDGKYICEIQSEANARRIVQMNNSHDGLVEAIKKVVNIIGLTVPINMLKVKDILTKAIAQVEE